MKRGRATARSAALLRSATSCWPIDSSEEFREAGFAVGQDANVLLHVSTSRLGETSSGAARGPERTYSELGGLAGGCRGCRPCLRRA